MILSINVNEGMKYTDLHRIVLFVSEICLKIVCYSIQIIKHNKFICMQAYSFIKPPKSDTGESYIHILFTDVKKY